MINTILIRAASLALSEGNNTSSSTVWGSCGPGGSDPRPLRSTSCSVLEQDAEPCRAPDAAPSVGVHVWPAPDEQVAHREVTAATTVWTCVCVCVWEGWHDVSQAGLKSCILDTHFIYYSCELNLYTRVYRDCYRQMCGTNLVFWPQNMNRHIDGSFHLLDTCIN